MTERKIPNGISISGTVILMSASLALLSALGAAAVAINAGGPQDIYQSSILYVVFGSPFLLLISGIGLLKLKNWARLLSIGFLPLMGIHYIYSVYQSFAKMFSLFRTIPDDISLELGFLSIGLAYFWIAFYLTRPQVRSFFKKNENESKLLRQRLAKEVKLARARVLLRSS